MKVELKPMLDNLDMYKRHACDVFVIEQQSQFTHINMNYLEQFELSV
jgi:hypothetical protein